MKPLDDGLKQRLIGAILLLALAVIFLPVLFDRDPIEPVDRTSQIPPPPDIITVEITAPDMPEVQDLAPPPEQMYVPDEEQVIDLQAELPGLNANGVPKSWVLQIASFRLPEHADKLREQLVAKGFAAYTRRVKSQNGSITRVLVGPKLDKQALIINKQEIDKFFNVEALLLEFKPD